MKEKIEKKIEIPEGASCEYREKNLICKKGSVEILKTLDAPNVAVSVEGNSVVFKCLRGNKNELKIINSYIRHLQNMLAGLNEKFIYKLEACNVHFPMSIKIEGDKIAINNFLGEKTPRYAKIVKNAEVQIKGVLITVSSNNKEAAGQTAANIERATMVRGRDRRIFQDGIFITDKPERRLE